MTTAWVEYDASAVFVAYAGSVARVANAKVLGVAAADSAANARFESTIAVELALACVARRASCLCCAAVENAAALWSRVVDSDNAQF